MLLRTADWNIDTRIVIAHQYYALLWFTDSDFLELGTYLQKVKI